MYRSLFVLCVSVLLVCPAQGQDNSKIPISFLPPPLETATYSLGIYQAKSGQLVRRLQEGATQNAFTVGLNGLITNWDGKDDTGKVVPPGKYAAHGYAVGALKVEGEDILGNDWTADDENLRVQRIEAIAAVPLDGGVAVLASMVNGERALLRISGDGKILWRKAVGALPAEAQPWLEIEDRRVFLMPKPPSSDGGRVSSVGSVPLDERDESSPDGVSIAVEEKQMPLPPLPAGARMIVPPPPSQFSPSLSTPGLHLDTGARAIPAAPEKSHFVGGEGWGSHSPGKDDTTWTAAGLNGLVQTGRDATVLRRLEVTPGDPLPIAVSASRTQDRLYLLEEKPGWQRLRGLSWVQTKEENGKPVSTWQTFFERNTCPVDPTPGSGEPLTPLEIGLMENPLDPGKAQRVKLHASVDEKGSYLTAGDGLRLRRISQRANLKAAKLAKGKAPGSLTFYQTDDAAWDEFSIEGVRNMMAFDAGEIDMTADGERTHPEKAAEPPDL